MKRHNNRVESDAQKRRATHADRFDVMVSAMRIAGASLVLLIAACATSIPDRDHSDEDIHETVFRYLFDNYASHLQGAARVYCLSIREADPRPGLMARFATAQPPVRHVSECTSNIRGVTEKSTGTHGVIFSVGVPRWLSDVEAEVGGGHYQDGRNASSDKFIVRWDGKAWRVVRTIRGPRASIDKFIDRWNLNA